MAVKIVGPAPSDFTTIAAWFASLPSTFTEDEVCALKGGWHGDPMGGDHRITLSGKTTSPTARLIIRAALPSDDPLGTYGITEDQSHLGDLDAGAKLAVNFGGEWAVLNINLTAPQYVILEDLNFHDADGNTSLSSSGSAYAIRFNATVGYAIINRCIFNNHASPWTMGSGAAIQDFISVTNCLGYDLRGHGQNLNNTKTFLFNCTYLGVQQPSRAGVRNCKAFNSYFADFGNGANGWYNSLATNGAGFHGNATNDGSTNAVTSAFRNISRSAALNADLTPTPDYLAGAGVAIYSALSASLTEALADPDHLQMVADLLLYDIAKRPRDTDSPSIGAFEPAASAPPASSGEGSGGLYGLPVLPFSGSATGGAQASGGFPSLSALPLAGTGSASATASGGLHSLPAVSFSGHAIGSAVASAPMALVELIPPYGAAKGDAVAVGSSFGPLPVLPISGVVSSGGEASGSLPSVSASPFDGDATSTTPAPNNTHIIWQIPFWTHP